MCGKHKPAKQFFVVVVVIHLVSQVGWLTVKDYHTFAWALAPEGYQTGTDANCSVAFYCRFACDL